MLSLVEIGPVVKEKKILKFCQFTLVIFFPLKRVWSFILKSWGCFEESLAEIGHVVLEKKKYEKLTTMTITTTLDNGHTMIRKAHLSLKLSRAYKKVQLHDNNKNLENNLTINTVWWYKIACTNNKCSINRYCTHHLKLIMIIKFVLACDRRKC